MMPEKLQVFVLRLAYHITKPVKDTSFLSQDQYDAFVEDKLEQLADFIWEDYKDKIQWTTREEK